MVINQLWCSAGSEEDGASGTGVLEAPAKPTLKKPSLYRVTLLNDDYTPMEFVVEILQVFFGMSREKSYSSDAYRSYERKSNMWYISKRYR